MYQSDGFRRFDRWNRKKCIDQKASHDLAAAPEQLWTIRWHLFLRTLRRSETNKTAKSLVIWKFWESWTPWPIDSNIRQRFAMIYLFKPPWLVSEISQSPCDGNVTLRDQRCLAGSWFWPSDKPERRFLSQWDFENNTHSTGIEERVRMEWRQTRCGHQGKVIRMIKAPSGWLIREFINHGKTWKKTWIIISLHESITNGPLIQQNDVSVGCDLKWKDLLEQSTARLESSVGNWEAMMCFAGIRIVIILCIDWCAETTKYWTDPFAQTPNGSAEVKTWHWLTDYTTI